MGVPQIPFSSSSCWLQSIGSTPCPHCLELNFKLINSQFFYNVQQIEFLVTTVTSVWPDAFIQLSTPSHQEYTIKLSQTLEKMNLKRYWGETRKRKHWVGIQAFNLIIIARHNLPTTVCTRCDNSTCLLNHETNPLQREPLFSLVGDFLKSSRR